jgi:hypothetical protein
MLVKSLRQIGIYKSMYNCGPRNLGQKIERPFITLCSDFYCRDHQSLL